MGADPLLQLVVALALSLLFAGAARHKQREPARFAAQLGAYRLLPDLALKPLARALPVIEYSVAVLLLPAATRPLAAGIAAVLLLVYSAAMLLNLARGRRDIDCGCGGPGQMLSYGLVLRNLLLISGPAVLFMPSGIREWHWTDVPLAMLLAGLLSLGYLALGQVMHNAGLLRGEAAHES